MRRLHCETADWHVFARGTRRLVLFQDEEDHLQFITFLKYSLRLSGCTLWAFVLMSNHYHLVLRGNSSQLTACMHRLNTMYSHYHNRKYGLNGHTFDGPYHAFRQATLLLTLQCIAYVFLNPVKGGLCPCPEDYRWSCYRSYLSLPGAALEVYPIPLVESVDPQRPTAWAKFHQAMEREARRPDRPSHQRLTMVEAHLQQFEWLLDFSKERADLFPGVDPVDVAIYWAKQVGIAPRAIAAGLGMTDSRVVRQILRRMTNRLARNPSLRAALSPP